MKSEVFNSDCLEGMRNYPDGYFDLAVVDPPYGIKENGNRDLIPKGAASARKKYDPSLWDCSKPSAEYYTELFRVSKNQIIWGGNYFTDHLPESRCWLVWDKRDNCPGNDFADCELAWTSLTGSVRMFKYLWNGMLQANMKNKEVRIHPTHKPIALYDWIFKNYTEPGFKILDTHLGGGSSRIAADKSQLEFVGFEISEKYYQDQEKRFIEYKSQLVLFQ